MGPTMEPQNGRLCPEDVLSGIAQPGDLLRIQGKLPVLARLPGAWVQQLVQHQLHKRSKVSVRIKHFLSVAEGLRVWDSRPLIGAELLRQLSLGVLLHSQSRGCLGAAD